MFRLLLTNTYREHNVPHLINENLVSGFRPQPARRPSNSASNETVSIHNYNVLCNYTIGLNIIKIIGWHI